MRPRIPDDLPAQPVEAYRRGWHDGHRAMSSKGGSRTSDEKAAAARANGAKGGRPRKRKE
jgi:hypothetical protein